MSDPRRPRHSVGISPAGAERLEWLHQQTRVPRAVLVAEAVRRLIVEYQDTGTVRFTGEER